MLQLLESEVEKPNLNNYDRRLLFKRAVGAAPEIPISDVFEKPAAAAVHK